MASALFCDYLVNCNIMTDYLKIEKRRERYESISFFELFFYKLLRQCFVLLHLRGVQKFKLTRNSGDLKVTISFIH